MKRPAILFSFAIAISMFASAAHAQQSALNCDIGPINRTFGNTPWLVYSCNDQKSFVMVSAPGSPAMPFVFLLHPKDGAYRLQGEGTGSKAASDAAAAEIQSLSGNDLGSILLQTRQAKAEAEKAAGKPAP